MKVPEHPAQHDTLQKVKNSTKEIMLLVGIRKREMGTKEHRGVLVTRDGVQQSWEGLVLLASCAKRGGRGQRPCPGRRTAALGP